MLPQPTHQWISTTIAKGVEMRHFPTGWILLLTVLLMAPTKKVSAQAPMIPVLQMQMPVAIYEALAALGMEGQSLTHFATLARGLGGTAQTMTQTYAGSPVASELMGYSMIQNGGAAFHQQLANLIRQAPSYARFTDTRFASFLESRTGFQKVVSKAFPNEGALRNLARTAQAWARSVPGRAVTQAAAAAEATVAAEAGGSAAAQSYVNQLANQFQSAVQSFFNRFGSANTAAAESTMFQVAGFMAIAGATQLAISAAESEYVATMESLGDAAEAEAWNNNVRLLMDRLTSGKVKLAAGMTFADALKRMRSNMENGTVTFEGVVDGWKNLDARKPGTWHWPVEEDHAWIEKTPHILITEENRKPKFYIHGGIHENIYFFNGPGGLLRITGRSVHYVDMAMFRSLHKKTDEGDLENDRKHSRWEMWQVRDNEQHNLKLIFSR